LLFKCAVTVDLTLLQAALPIETGQIIGERYLVGEVLGGGGMGVVRAGTHVLLGTPVAIKVIHSELKHDAEAVQRFVNEARAAAALKGEHIARVFDVGVLESGEPYLIMEQLEGMGLDQYLAGRGPLTPVEAVDIVLQVCEGLTEAHAAGLVHRDIKPANLFLARRPDGQLSAKILDFGIAKRLDAPSPALTDPGRSLGSPWYMSPEQMLTPASVDARADVWSLGVLLF
jgi:eukaryotic-like serine/threonine-protein kinase